MRIQDIYEKYTKGKQLVGMVDNCAMKKIVLSELKSACFGDTRVGERL